MLVEEEKAKRQCEQLDKAWEILNEAAVEPSGKIATLPPNIYVPQGS